MFVVMALKPFEFMDDQAKVLFSALTNAVGYMPVYASREEAENDFPGRRLVELAVTEPPAIPLLVGEGTEERKG